VSRINPLARELVAKIVYYGPGLSGKTTSLQYVHQTLPRERRGEMVSLSTETDRTIFFDFLPVRLARVGDMTVRLQLYTVPGQVFYAETRKLVLNGADGVVFVADSQKTAEDMNLSSLDDLKDNLEAYGIDLAEFPLVFQYNKRDLSDLQSVEELDRALNHHGAPRYETCATLGKGIFPALKDVVRLVIGNLKARREAQQRVRSFDALPSTDTGVSAEPSLASAISLATASAEGDALADAGPAPDDEAVAPVFSFAPLFETAQGHDQLLMVEGAIRDGAFAVAVSTAAGALAELLEEMPGVAQDDGVLSRALMLGLDGREYLKLCRLASSPSETLHVEDALFSLNMLVSARVKLDSV
jgi:signal recognition particle receptor subunit beta